MNEVTKFVGTAFALVFAGVAGYGVAAYAVKDLNTRVLNAAEQLGRVQEKIDQTTRENDELKKALAETAKENEEAKKATQQIKKDLQEALKSDAGKAATAIKLLAENADIQSFLDKLDDIDRSKIESCRIELRSHLGDCAKNIREKVATASPSPLTEKGGGWSGWSGALLTSEWNGTPWNCLKARLHCE